MLSPLGPVFRGNSYKNCCLERQPTCSETELACCLNPPETKKLVLFNFGAYDGKALSKWLEPENHRENVVSSVLVNEGLIQRFQSSQIHLVAVEANPEAFASLHAAKIKWETDKGYKVTIIEAGAAITNGTMMFGAPDNGEADKRDGHRVRPNAGLMEIKTIDTAALIRDHCTPGDVCICAFDVEGMEFEIMRDLFFKRPSVGCLCDVLIVEWHEMISEDEEYLIVNDFGQDKYNLRHIPAQMLAGAIMDGALRFMLEARDETCPTVYIGFRYDQAVFDI
jgi:FkbM family methyltransferase